MNEIGDKIKEYRERLNMSQEELANMIGISRIQVSRIERGIHVPSIEVVLNAIKAFKTSPAEFWENKPLSNIICPNCGIKKHNTDARFCRACGEPLYNFCTNCGSRLTDSANFCADCGGKAIRNRKK